MKKIVRWFEEVLAPNTAAARKRAEEFVAKAKENAESEGGILRPILAGKPVYDTAHGWTIESSRELAVGENVVLLKGTSDGLLTDNLMVSATITSIISSVSERGNFVYAVDFGAKETASE